MEPADSYKASPYETLTQAIITMALATDEGRDCVVWAENQQGIPGIAVQTVARASGYKEIVVERRARQFKRGAFWFTRTPKEPMPGTPWVHPGYPVYFVTGRGLAAIFGHLPPYHFKDPIRRLRAEGLQRLAHMCWSSGDRDLSGEWQALQPFLISIGVDPILVDEDLNVVSPLNLKEYSWRSDGG